MLRNGRLEFVINDEGKLQVPEFADKGAPARARLTIAARGRLPQQPCFSFLPSLKEFNNGEPDLLEIKRLRFTFADGSVKDDTGDTGDTRAIASQFRA